MKIGEKEFTAKIDNRIIRDIETAFGTGALHGEKSISLILGEAADFSTIQMGVLIWHTVKHEMNFDEFNNLILLNQYIDCITEIIPAINKAFGLDIKKK